jgi:hypothetical protein
MVKFTMRLYSFVARLSVTLLMLFAISACNDGTVSRAMTCEEVLSDDLHTFIGTAPTELEVTQWALTEYEGSNPELSEQDKFPAYSYIEWDSGAVNHAVAFTEGEATGVTRTMEGATFTLAQTLDCLGVPDYYSTGYYLDGAASAFSGNGRAGLTVWYLDEGVAFVFDKQASDNQAQIEFRGDEPIRSMRYTRDTTAEAMTATENGEPWSADTMPVIVPIPQ